MRIVILLGGTGSRFSAVGYEKPKPFILVDGKTMVEHVISMYPGSHEYIFVCSEIFRNSEVLQAQLANLPNSRAVFIPPHKLGPVYTLSYVWKELPADEPVMVTYCDFNATWDFADFCKQIASPAWDGAVPSYTGFHPHLLHKKKYAGVMADTTGKMIAIKEKYSFTENPADSFHSAGNYYFSKAGEMRKYGEALLENEEAINGEKYVSMLYYQYLSEGKNILVYPLKHFMQWGTPEDLEEYAAWAMYIQAERGETDIPEGRRNLIRIPHPENSPEFKQSEAYWHSYFLN